MPESPTSRAEMAVQIRALQRRVRRLMVICIVFGVLLISAAVLIPTINASRNAAMRFEGYVVPVRPIPDFLRDSRGLVIESKLDLAMRLALQSSVGMLDDAKSTPLQTWTNVTRSGTPFKESGANLLTSYAPLPEAFFNSLPSSTRISPDSQFGLSLKYRVREFPDEEDPEQRLFLMLELRRLARDGDYTVVRDTAILAELADRLTAQLQMEITP